MAIQAQLYSDNIGFPICGSLDLIDNGCGLVGAAAGFNQQISSQLQQLQQFQHLQNQHQRDQTFSFGSTNNNRESIMFEKQRYEIDQFIKSQNERLRLLLQEQRKQQYEVLVKKIESKASFLLRQKDEEIVKARNKTMELQNMLKKLEMENQAWQRVAQENEAMVVSLNNRLEQVREEQASCRFNNGVDDAESCCECEDNNEGIMETKGNGSFAAVDSSNQRQEEQEEKTTMVCKCCYCRNSSVLFLPCRHLCSCKDCATFLDSCPVCRTPKKACIEAFVCRRQKKKKKKKKKKREQKMAIQIPRVKLGTQGFEVSKLGFGCMGLSGHNNSVSDEAGIAIIKHAFERGITHFDTADMYGPKTNEILVGKALKHLPREKVQLATKFGVESMGPGGPVINGTPEFVRSSLEASLQRLDVDYIDLYYIIRVDHKTPIEDTMEELKKLVEEGKIKYIGISEASPETIRRAHAVHPLTAVQLEWSLWTRDVEEEIIPLCRKLGIGIVPYSPLGRGFFAGRANKDTSNTPLRMFPRFSGENLEKNRILYSKVEKLAEKHGCTAAQLALAWVLHQGDDVAPIPGTTKIENLDSNIESVKVKLTKEDLKEIIDTIPIHEVAGSNYPDSLKQFTWKYGNTPPKKST